MTASSATFVPDSAHVAEIHPAANVEPRRGGRTPDLLLLHYTGMRSAAAAVAWLARADSKVSCHYVIDVDGRITQQVPEALRAWHAGLSCWAGETDINSCAIGIEIQNPGHELGYHDFPAAQMRGVADLAVISAGAALSRRSVCWRIPMWHRSEKLIQARSLIGAGLLARAWAPGFSRRQSLRGMLDLHLGRRRPAFVLHKSSLRAMATTSRRAGISTCKQLR